MANDLQLILRLQAEGTGQVTASLASVGQSMEQLAQESSQAGAATASAVGEIGSAAHVSAGQTEQARRIVVSNLVNMAQAAVVTQGNLIATLSPLPDVLYGISQMGAGAAGTARAMMAWGAATAVVVGGLAAIVMHASTLEARTRQMTVALKAMGDSAGVSGDQLRKMSEAAAASGSFSRSETADAALVLASHARIPGGAYGSIFNTAVDFSAATGQDLSQGINTLASALDQGYAGIKKLDESFNFLTRDQLSQIRTMAEHGRQTEAMQVAVDALNQRFKGLAKEGMSEFRQATNTLATEFSQMMDRISNSDLVLSGMRGLAGLFRLARGGTFAPDATTQPATGAASPPPAARESDAAWLAAQAAREQSSKRLDELREQAAQMQRVLAAPAPLRSIMQAAVDAENQSKSDNLLGGDVAQLGILKTSQAYQQIAASARDATAVMRLNADAQGRVAQTAGISDAAMRHTAVANDVARFSYEYLGMGVAAYRHEAERAFASEESARRRQWTRTMDDQAAVANRLAEAYRSGSVAAVDVAERENAIQAAMRQVGVHAAEAATQIDKLFAHQWDQQAVQINRANDSLLAYRQGMEELEKSKATGILTERAYAEQARKLYRDMLDASKAWKDGASRAVLAYADDAGNAARQAERFFGNAFRGMEDALVQFATTGKLQFAGFVQSVLSDLVRMQIQASITLPLFKGLNSGEGFLGSIGAALGLGGTAAAGAGGAGIPLTLSTRLSSVAHGGGIMGADVFSSRSVASALFHTAPRLHEGGVAEDEIPAILQRGEGVFTPAQMRRLAPAARQTERPAVTVQIIDQRQSDSAPVQVQRAQGAGGTDLIRLIIPGIVQDLARRGPLAQSFERTYRLQRGTA
ncbi:MAG: phage tail length tape measure family protein [Magnetococcus sp. MYC-9]